jgi:hypothetical protein
MEVKGTKSLIRLVLRLWFILEDDHNMIHNGLVYEKTELLLSEEFDHFLGRSFS